MIILKQINEIAFLEMSAYPVFFQVIFQYSISFEYITFKLAYVWISILEYFLAKSIELAVNVVSSFDHIELEGIFMSWCLYVIVAWWVSDDIWEG